MHLLYQSFCLYIVVYLNCLEKSLWDRFGRIVICLRDRLAAVPGTAVGAGFHSHGCIMFASSRTAYCKSCNKRILLTADTNNDHTLMWLDGSFLVRKKASSCGLQPDRALPTLTG